MLKNYIFAILILSIANLNSEELILDIGNARENSIYFNLDSKTEHLIDNNNWDLAFENSFSSGIRINGQAGVKLWLVPKANISDFGNEIDTNGIEEWERHHDSDVRWSIGAFNMGMDGFQSGGDFGWGQYANTVINGMYLFVIELRDGSYKQFAMESLMSGIFTFKMADLDGSNIVEAEYDKSDYLGQNFGYFDLLSANSLGREPNSGEWHLEFSRYEELVSDNQGNMLPYPVVGIRQNKNLIVAQLDGVEDVKTELPPSLSEFSTNINTIGHDWKELNFSTFQYDMVENRVYFAQEFIVDNEQILPIGDIYRIYFNSFSRGEIGFNLEKVTPASVNSFSNKIQLAIYPNIIERGESISLIYSGLEEIGTYEIYDINGNIIKSDNLISTSTLSAEQINVNVLSSGLYVIKLNSGDVSVFEKLIVK